MDRNSSNTVTLNGGLTLDTRLFGNSTVGYFESLMNNTPFQINNHIRVYKSMKFEDDVFTLKIVLPQVKKEDITLTTIKDELEIKVKGNEFVDSFTATYNIEDYNKKSIKFNLANGVLVVEIDKKESAKPKVLKW